MSDPTRLSAIEMLILKMLIANGAEMYGLEMIEQSGKRLKRGTIYVTLGRMEEKGFVESRKEDARPTARGLPRRLYKPAAQGVRTLQEWELPNDHPYKPGVIPAGGAV